MSVCVDLVSVCDRVEISYCTYCTKHGICVCGWIERRVGRGWVWSYRPRLGRKKQGGRRAIGARMWAARSFAILAVCTVAHGLAGTSPDLVEDDTTPLQHACPGNPEECSGHGKCIALQCHCYEGYFGQDCHHRNRECTKLKSCSDCQNPANQKYCGWCAGDRYCVPKHVHKALDRKGKSCAAWHEDTCPRNMSATNARDDILMEWGDDRSVALADALVAMIDEAGGKGTSSLVGTLLILFGIGCVVLCTMREKRADERRKRFEAFMADESEALKARSTGGMPGSPWGLVTPHSRQLGPPAPPADGPAPDVHTRALADAIGQGAEFGSNGRNVLPSGGGHAQHACAAQGQRERLLREHDAADDAADAARAEAAMKAKAEALHRSVRDAARRDIEERKEKRRALAEETRQSAMRLDRAAAEEKARAELQQRIQAMRPAATSIPVVSVASSCEAEAATVVADSAVESADVNTANAVAGVRAIQSSSPPVCSMPGAPPAFEAAFAPGDAATATSRVRPPKASGVEQAAKQTPDNLKAAEAEFLAALDDFE